jgi:hypothetical protein
MGVDDQIKAAIQDLIAPALHEIRGDIQAIRTDIKRIDQKIDNADGRLGDKIDSLSAQMGHMRGELIAEIRRVDARIDGVDRELRTAIDIRERLAALEARRA